MVVSDTLLGQAVDRFLHASGESFEDFGDFEEGELDIAEEENTTSDAKDDSSGVDEAPICALSQGPARLKGGASDHSL